MIKIFGYERRFLNYVYFRKYKICWGDDKDIDLFESQYVVPDGVSYNSYIIFVKKIT